MSTTTRVNLEEHKSRGLTKLPNTRVVGYHETPPTATKAELWDMDRILEFIDLLRATADDIVSKLESNETRCRKDGECHISMRYVRTRIVARCGRKNCLEFRRIYPTIWAHATNPGTSEEDMHQFKKLVKLTAMPHVELDR